MLKIWGCFTTPTTHLSTVYGLADHSAFHPNTGAAIVIATSFVVTPFE